MLTLFLQYGTQIRLQEPIWIYSYLMKGYEELEVIDYRIIPGCTPDYVVSELSEMPLIYQHWKKNNQENQKSLIDAFMRLPTKADGPGFIYGFRERKSYNSADRSYWIKMGRTKREVPQDRIFEWEKADKHTYNQIFTIRSQYNSKLQLLVHLIFAYARKPIKINDNLRIQWFQFHEKVPTAAITNLANLLMEKIHEKFINKIEELQREVFPAYDAILQKLVRREKFTLNQFNIVAFGLPKTGKTLFKTIISEDQVVAEKGEKGMKLIVKPNQKKRQSNYIQISDFQNLTNPEEALEQYFATWHKLCSSKAILPLLFVKQSDLQASKLLGLTQGLSLLERYVKATSRVIIVVTHARHSFTAEEAKECIEDNKEFLTKSQLKFLLQSQYIIVKRPQKAGSFPTKSEKEAISKLLASEEAKILELSAISDCTIQFKMEKQYLKPCHQIIQKSYLVLQPIYASKFLARYHEYLQDDLRDIFVQKIHEFIDKLKQQDQSQQSIHAAFKKCSQLLELSPQEQLQSFLYIFCEFCSNKTMQYSEITSLLSQKVNERIVSINQKYISTIDIYLESYSNAISVYISKKQDGFVDLLMKVMSESSVSNMIKIFCSIVQEGKKKPTVSSQPFVKATERIVQALSFIEDKMNKGFRMDSVLGKIRQTIYYGLKGEPKQIEEIKIVEPFQEVTEAENEESSPSIQDCMKEQIDNLSALQNKIEHYPEGSTILNVVRQFVVDTPPKKYSVKHNIFILAKEIKVYSSCDISFKTVYKGEEKKLKLMFMSEQFTNYEKMNIPTASRNGVAFILNIVKGDIITLKPQVKAQIYEKNVDAIAILKKIYDSKFP